MHYYQHHIGDFIKDTSFLTNEEVGIYLKLLWLYYDTEKPLPNSLFELSMKVSAREQQDALSGILEMFFTLKNNEWHHTRCDKEIEHYHQQLNTASKAGKASAAKRAMNKQSTGVQRALDSCSTDVQPTNNQEPRTNNHKPKKEQQRGSRLPVDFVYPKEWADFCLETRPDLNLQNTFDEFKDYWTALPLGKGTKSDWFATWRNWVRRQNAPKQAFVNRADVATMTVPAAPNQDAALRKIEEDRKKATPMPDSVRILAQRMKVS